MASGRKTTLTLDMFEEALLPRIKEILEEKLAKYRVEVIGFKEEVLGEIKDLRDEVKVTLGQYERTNDKVDRIAKHLDLPRFHQGVFQLVCLSVFGTSCLLPSCREL